MTSPSKMQSANWDKDLELSPIDGLARHLTEMAWSPSTEAPVSTNFTGDDAGFVLPQPKNPIAHIMKAEEPSPSLQSSVLKDVSNRADIFNRPTGWRRRLLVAGSNDKGNQSPSRAPSSQGSQTGTPGAKLKQTPRTALAGHHPSDEGIQLSGSLFSSSDSQEDALYGSTDSKQVTTSELPWDMQDGAKGTLDSGATCSSDDGFLSSLEDSFQERESQLPGSYDKLFNSPVFATSVPSMVVEEFKENSIDSENNPSGPHAPSASEQPEAVQGRPVPWPDSPVSSLVPPASAAALCLANNNLFKRPVSPEVASSSPSQKRCRAGLLQRVTSYNEPRCSTKVANLPRSLSDPDASIKLALQKSDQDPDLIGDCSKPYALPLVRGKHQDLKMILPSTLADVLQGKYRSVVDEAVIIDCRYPFEYKGGHIQGSINVYSLEALVDEFFGDSAPAPCCRQILVFHCEFSSERGPKLSRLLREKDRQLHILQYPALKHPEIYVLEGGYKAFYEEFRDLCTPQGYIPMRHKDYEAELRYYRSIAKTEGTSSKMRGALQVRCLQNKF